MENIAQLVEIIKSSKLNEEEKIRFLKVNRCRLLDEIHKKQQLLDQIDYLIIQSKEK